MPHSPDQNMSVDVAETLYVVSFVNDFSDLGFLVNRIMFKSSPDHSGIEIVIKVLSV